jgi:hypothetical protein
VERRASNFVAWAEKKVGRYSLARNANAVHLPTRPQSAVLAAPPIDAPRSLIPMIYQSTIPTNIDWHP